MLLFSIIAIFLISLKSTIYGSCADTQKNLTSSGLDTTAPMLQNVSTTQEKTGAESSAEIKWLPLLGNHQSATDTLEASSIARSDAVSYPKQLDELVFDGKQYKTMIPNENDRASPDAQAIMPGKRRYDRENLALASTGQNSENKFIMPEPQETNPLETQYFMPQKRGRARSRAEFSHRLDASMGEQPVEIRRRDSRDQVRPNRPLRSRLNNDQGYYGGQYRDESRRNVVRPVLNRPRTVEEQIFKDDDDGSSPALDRRAGQKQSDEGGDDGDDDDDEDGDDVKPAPRAVNRPTQTRRSMALAATRQRQATAGKMREPQSRQRQQAGNARRQKQGRQYEEGSADYIDSTHKIERNSVVQGQDLKRTAQLGLKKSIGRKNEIEASLEDIEESPSANQLMHSSAELQTAAGHHHDHHHGYYQYAGVPKKKAWKFGFKRGNHKHTSEYSGTS